MNLLIESITPATDGFAALLSESLHFQFNMLNRLQANWRSGENRFEAEGEKLVGAFCNERLIGVCGLNQDPYSSEPRMGRVRHLYVSYSWRRMNTGRLLLNSIIQDAERCFDSLNTHAPDSAFAFYERMGFRRTEGRDNVTHRLFLPMPGV